MKLIKISPHLVIILICFFSCKKESKHIEISDKYKLEALNSILKDTVDLKILASKKRMISNTPWLVPIPSTMFYLDSLTNDFKEIGSLNSFLSRVLNNDNDTLFIKNQIKKNKFFELDALSNYGYQILDLKKGPNIVEADSLVREYNKNYNFSGYLIVSKPIFNKSLDKVFLRVRNGGSGYSLVLEKKNGKWEKIQELNSWVE